MNVYLNDEDVRVLDGLDTAVGERDVLVILPGHGRRLAAGPPGPVVRGLCELCTLRVRLR